jgi:hypothetical protein
MENLIFINKSNIFKFAELMNYGQNVVKFESDELVEIVKKQSETINEMLKLSIFRVEKLVNNVLEGNEWIAHEIPGYFNIIYSNRDNIIDIPTLSNDDLNIVDLAIKAAVNKEGVKININEKLYPKAKKIAKEKNIKFKIFDNYQYFDGKQKSVSVYSQIEQALLDGKDSISFNKSEVRVETVRVHTCSIGKFNHKKMSVTVEGDNIIVYINDSEKMLKKVQETFDELVMTKPNDYKEIWLNVLSKLNPEVSLEYFVKNDKNKYLTFSNPNLGEAYEIKKDIPEAEGVKMSDNDWSDIEQEVLKKDSEFVQNEKKDPNDDF